jgi:hypothetical protein
VGPVLFDIFSDEEGSILKHHGDDDQLDLHGHEHKGVDDQHTHHDSDYIGNDGRAFGGVGDRPSIPELGNCSQQSKTVPLEGQGHRRLLGHRLLHDSVVLNVGGIRGKIAASIFAGPVPPFPQWQHTSHDDQPSQHVNEHSSDDFDDQLDHRGYERNRDDSLLDLYNEPNGDDDQTRLCGYELIGGDDPLDHHDEHSGDFDQLDCHDNEHTGGQQATRLTVLPPVLPSFLTNGTAQTVSIVVSVTIT